MGTGPQRAPITRWRTPKAKEVRYTEIMPFQKIIASTTEELDKIKELVSELVVITSPVVRVYFKKLVNQFYQNVTVLSFSEMDNDIQIQALGNIAIDI